MNGFPQRPNIYVALQLASFIEDVYASSHALREAIVAFENAKLAASDMKLIRNAAERLVCTIYSFPLR